MKKVLLTLLVFLAFAFSAHAQAPTPFSAYVGGLVSMPNTPSSFSDTWKTGWHATGGLGYKMAPNFQLVGKLEYHTFGFDFGDVDGFSGGNINLLTFGADGRYAFSMPAAPVAPFIFGGAGMANVSFGDMEGSTLATSTFADYNTTKPESQTKLYYNIGAGAEMKVGPTMKLFVQGRYVNVATDGESIGFIPITLGLRFF